MLADVSLFSVAAWSNAGLHSAYTAKGETAVKFMNVKLFISQAELGLDFECGRDRDVFFENMSANSAGGFSPQDAAEKVGDRTIRLHPTKFGFGWTWSVVFPER